MQNQFLGNGISTPLELSVKGGWKQSSDEARVEQSIRVILGTQYGERLMRPTFGCNLRTLSFAPNNDATANLARFYVEEGLRLWEPRIEVTDVTVTNDNRRAILLIHIQYRLRATQESRSLIYPFYLEQP